MSSPRSNQLLAHPEVAKAICGTLRVKGVSKQEVEDAQQEVYAMALRFFRIKPDRAPTELENMKALCAVIARRYAIDQLRKAKRREKDLETRCDRAEYRVVERESVPKRDPVDAQRQLEVLADLFREGAMPEHGLDILEGVASKSSYRKIGEHLELSADLVEWRMREMRRIYRQRMAKLGILPGMKPLHVVVSNPSAIRVLRQAA